MGNKQSVVEKGGDGGAAQDEETTPKHPIFFVAPVCDLDHLRDKNAVVVLRLEPEALVLYSPETKERLTAFPYHRVLCWGHSQHSFQFRYYTKDDELRLASVGTQEGNQIEAALMERVQGLMTKMESVGITDDEFSEVKSVIREDPDEALRSIKQVSLSRLFDARQAVEVVRLMGEVSPFDKVEAAVVLADALLNSESFTQILDEFEVKEDQENVKHRVEGNHRNLQRR
eukprot:gb/GECG01008976.1/.p1 GENE.gb/GECG01008976.1/~~gb/GECG01008976.1/.p1  ORF type:complete len:229 (+),score=39.90 gb/GECG01008976.1/:1-687(+)